MPILSDNTRCGTCKTKHMCSYFKTYSLRNKKKLESTILHSLVSNMRLPLNRHEISDARSFNLTHSVYL